MEARARSSATTRVTSKIENAEKERSASLHECEKLRCFTEEIFKRMALECWQQT